jgi:uracil-DNA glycosylase family 4
LSTTQSQLDQIAADILTQNICPDLAKSANQLVFGDGNPNASIVFIGEAPGKKEDETGKPFVGAAGRFLDEMLASISLKRSDIYITNIVKYRPPNNRDPLPEEKKAFLPFLQAQLEVIQPKIVITLGRHSTNCFLPGVPSCASCKAGGSPEQCLALARSEHRKNGVAVTTSFAEHKGMQGQVRSGEPSSTHPGRACDTPLQISKIHGEPKRIKLALKQHQGDVLEIVILPLYHPAAALYNGSMRTTLLEDFSRIPLILSKIT